MKISEQAQQIVGTWSEGQNHPLELRLTAADHPDAEQLRKFCRWLADSCNMVQVAEIPAAPDELPALSLRQGTILYRAVPAGTELEPFLEALGAEPEAGGYRTAAMRIHVAASCPHCPNAVRTLLPLAAAGGPVTLEVIDSETCRNLAEADKVKSVPTLILDDTFRWTGGIRPGDMEALLTPGDRWDLDTGVLERLLENGNAGPLAALMFEEGHASPALCRLMAAEAMSVRLGAMMVVEDLLERDAVLVERLIPALQQVFATAPEPARGDMLYIFGEAGPPSMVQEIEALLAADLHPEVAEAAREALDRLAERHP